VLKVTGKREGMIWGHKRGRQGGNEGFLWRQSDKKNIDFREEERNG
jgi:hypothetical protein